MNPAITRLKLLGILLFSTSIVLFRDIRVVGTLFACTLLLFFIERQYLNLKKRLLPLMLITLFVICFQTLFNHSVPLDQRVLIGFTAGVRIMTLSLLVFLFSQTTSPLALMRALSFLPVKLRLVFTISLSLIPILIREIDFIRIAQQSRGYTSNWKHPFGSVVPLIVPLLHRTLTRAEHIAIVLQTRGFE